MAAASENPAREWMSAILFLAAFVAGGTALFYALYALVLPDRVEQSFTPQETAQYLCRTRFERDVPAAFLTANPESQPVAGGFDVLVRGTSAGTPVAMECDVRGNQVMRFDAHRE